MASMNLKLLCSAMKSVTRFDMRRSIACTSKSYHTGKELSNVRKFQQIGLGTMGLRSATYSQCFRSQSGLRFSDGLVRSSLPVAGMSPFASNRLFSSASEAKGNIARGTETIADSSVIGTNVTDISVGGDDWIEKLKEVYQSTIGAVKYTGEKVKEVSDQAAPHVEQLLDTNPYLRDVIVPVSGTMVATLLAWSLLPRLLKCFHKYSNQAPGALLARSSVWGSVTYEKSFWGALENPIRYFVTFTAFMQIGNLVAPTVIVSQYMVQTWRGALIISLVWFLHRWKTSVIARTLVAKSIVGSERDTLLIVDKVSSVGLFVVGSMALAEASGVAVQSILTVGGIGGVATAFAAKDILGNVLSGLTVQLSQPFSIGDTIKAGSIEGQVVEMGFTTTSLVTAENFPVIVPNSLFSSQVIVNKSRAKWRSLVRKVPLRVDDIDKIPQISVDIKSMLKSHPNVFLEKEAPYCFLSHIEKSYAELTIGCNLKHMDKDAQQDILLQIVRIIKEHGAELGSTKEDIIV